MHGIAVLHISKGRHGNAQPAPGERLRNLGARQSCLPNVQPPPASQPQSLLPAAGREMDPRNYGRGRCRPTSGPVVISHGSTSSEVAIAMLRSGFHTANQTNASPLISNHGRKLAGSITPPHARRLDPAAITDTVDGVYVVSSTREPVRLPRQRLLSHLSGTRSLRHLSHSCLKWKSKLGRIVQAGLMRPTTTEHHCDRGWRSYALTLNSIRIPRWI
jgi:hypothetical protein